MTTKIQVLDNGPLLVSGPVDLVDGEGHSLEEKDEVALCRCGLSKNKPSCDGAHQGSFTNSIRADR
jgi:CDGSH-type Zn-finger protein